MTGLEIPPRGFTIIPEPDLYRLIMKSEMPDAERFQDWVGNNAPTSHRRYRNGGKEFHNFDGWNLPPAKEKARIRSSWAMCGGQNRSYPPAK